MRGDNSRGVWEHLLSEPERQKYVDALPKFAWHGFDHDTNQHEVGKFIDYPLIRGWRKDQIDAIWAGRASDRHHSECLAMLQSWFIFGFLEAVFRNRISLVDYLEAGGHGPTLNTAGLRGLLQRSAFAIMYNPDAFQHQESRITDFCRSVSKCLCELEIWYLNVAAHGGKAQFPELFDSCEFRSVLRSVHLVACAVQSANANIADMLQLENRGGLPASSAISDEQLHEKGWCPSLYDFFARYGPALPEYANLVRPTDPDHTRHRNCLRGQCCTGINVDPAHYRPKHVMQGCTCGFAVPNLQQTLDYLSEGSIPLIDLRGWDISQANQESGLEFLPVVTFKEGCSYVAFSHVWVDGLGSDTETGLPLCQIAALQVYALRAARIPIIWIDALCIPRERPFRKKAIQMMSEVYRKAHVTVVVDGGLKSHDLNLDSPATEIGFRLLTSVWMHRLWTLPECLLSRSVLFVFQREICSFEAIFKKIRRQRIFPIEYSVKEALKMYTVFRGKDQIPIGAIQRMLGGRDSSRLSDETLAICPMLRLPIAELFDLAGEERVSKFWLLVGSADNTIVFLMSSRLEKKGFRWAPKSLMSARGALRVESGVARETAKVTEGGLRGIFFTYFLH